MECKQFMKKTEIKPWRIVNVGLLIPKRPTNSDKKDEIRIMTVDQLNTLDASGTNWNFSLNGITSSALFTQNASELLATVTEPLFGSNATKNLVYPQCLWDNDFWNCTEEQYLAYWRGPRTLPLSTALSVSKIYILLNFCTYVIENGKL